MPKKLLIRTHEFPYHLTARSNNREWFYLPITQVWEIFDSLIIKATEIFDFRPICYVLMNNHWHIMAFTPNSNIDKIMHFIMKNMSNSINTQAQRINHVFGAPYKWTLIQEQKYYLNVIRYICQNPVRGGLSKTVEEYPYIKLPRVDVFDTSIAESEAESEAEAKGEAVIKSATNEQKLLQLITWLNITPLPEEAEGLQKGLSRTSFKLARNQQTRKPYKIDPCPHFCPR